MFLDWDGGCYPLLVSGITWVHHPFLHSIQLCKVEIVENKKRKQPLKEDDVQTNNEVNPQEDVIATIHVLKNKSQVRKRVVTRNNKENKE